MKRNFFLVILLLSISCGFHRPEVKVLPRADQSRERTLFIAFDGISHDMMNELKREGHFKDFQTLKPLIVPFPSATTIGFTGIFQPLNVGTVQGYETRFYSYKDNRVIGGTPWDVYKIHINYKSYFDAFRHTMIEKSVMYTLPGMAGVQDLERAEDLLYNSRKKVLFAYLGGTDGAQHILGKYRTKRFMVYVDRFIKRMKKRYEKAGGEPLRVILFSDHGFHFDKLHFISSDDIENAIKPSGFELAHHLVKDNDVLLVKFGLLSAGVVMTRTPKKELLANRLSDVTGMDLIFWPEKNKIHVLNSKSERAYFEYEWPKHYRYVCLKGDPLKYLPALEKNGQKEGAWIQDKAWFKITWDHEYPDVGHRLYDSFHKLVENKASLMFSLKPEYQFGGFAALVGTKLKFNGHKGTHGGIFQEVSYGMVMTDDDQVKLPPAIRYDDLFKIFLPGVTKAYLNLNHSHSNHNH